MNEYSGQPKPYLIEPMVTRHVGDVKCIPIINNDNGPRHVRTAALRIIDIYPPSLP